MKTIKSNKRIKIAAFQYKNARYGRRVIRDTKKNIVKDEYMVQIDLFGQNINLYKGESKPIFKNLPIINLLSYISFLGYPFLWLFYILTITLYRYPIDMFKREHCFGYNVDSYHKIYVILGFVGIISIVNFVARLLF
jgi:hypothetical protein